ncbi:MAG: BLUF domain-containing protein [Alphaproteobacteria bacterium]|nr:BLUF domain-containing protein [Alphaproteobacteria bacterium]
MSVRRLVYFSRSLTGPSDEDISAILETSRHRNKQEGVTGLLLHLQGVFAQVLEGPPKTISAVLDRIKRDPRHNQLTILTDETVSHSVFTDWSMAYVDTDVSNLLKIAGLSGVEDAMEAFANSTPNAAPPVVDQVLNGLSRQLEATISPQH